MCIKITVLHLEYVAQSWTLLWNIRLYSGLQLVPKESALPVCYRQPPFDSECESCSCAYLVGLSDISAVEQIREESELGVRRIPPFQIWNQAKQQTAPQTLC